MMRLKKTTLAFCLLAELCFAQHYPSDIPKMDGSFEHFDMHIFPAGDKHLRYEKKDAAGKTVYVAIDFNHYHENDSLHFTLKDYTRSADSGLMFGYDYSVNPIIGTFREFYPSGNIKQKGLYCVLGFKMGHWYSYDKKGKLVQTENWDDCYAFDYKKLFDFCIQNGLSLHPRNAAGAIETEISKYNGDWYVSYNGLTHKIFQLDGNTGQLIKFTETPPTQYGE